MAVGAIGAIGTMNYNPYIYNTNAVSANSLNPIKRIPDDATVGGADYSHLVKEEEENINPLKKGQTSNFADVIMSQMSMSAVRREDLISSTVQNASEDVPTNVIENLDEKVSSNEDVAANETSVNAYKMNQAIEAYTNSAYVA